MCVVYYVNIYFNCRPILFETYYFKIVFFTFSKLSRYRLFLCKNHTANHRKRLLKCVSCHSRSKNDAGKDSEKQTSGCDRGETSGGKKSCPQQEGTGTKEVATSEGKGQHSSEESANSGDTANQNGPHGEGIMRSTTELWWEWKSCIISTNCVVLHRMMA